MSSWTYDAPGALALPASETSWAASQPYRTRVTGYDDRNHPTSTAIDIPGTSSVSGTYNYGYTYNDAGTVTSVTMPAIGSILPGETVTTGLDDLGRPFDLTGSNTYVTSTIFDNLGRVTRRNMTTGSANEVAFARDYAYDGTTGRVSSIKGGWDTAVSTAGGETWFQDETLTYDAIGNPTSVLDQTTGVRECFRYDSWQRLTRAWTKGPSLTCEPGTSTPSASGANGFHEAYSIDLIGRMTTWTTTDLASSTTSTRNFTYGDAAHPDAPTSNGTMTLTYDANGSVATRAGTGLSWDALHRLIGISGTQTNVYGNDGLRLLRTDTTAGTVTLFLPGQQVTGPVGAGAVTTAIRSYQLGATTIATRTGPGATGVYWNCGQRQNSTSCSTPINTGSAPATPIARYLPYGTPRTGSPTLPGTERGFVGQITDTTGLNQLGQRVYDPTLGHFLSVDPLVSATGDPYLYTAGNPTTLTDPNGLEPGCSPNALAGACSAEHADQERIRPSYLEGSTPKRSDQVRQVQDYANVCINQWQWCVDSLADGDSHPIYGADGGLLDRQDLGLMSHAVALLMMLIGQGLAYVDGSGSGAVLRAGNLPMETTRWASRCTARACLTWQWLHRRGTSGGESASLQDYRCWR